jgi:hypothetical protein
MEAIFVILILWFIYRRRKRRRSARASAQMASSNFGFTNGNAYAGNSSGSQGWYTDPTSRYPLRYWDGYSWTENVTRGDGSIRIDPIITRVGMNGIPNVPTNRPSTPVVYQAPEPGTQQDGPDLNELRRRFNQ